MEPLTIPDPGPPPVRPPARIELPEGEVHVWRASLAEAGDATLLPADERERAGRFRFEGARARFVRSRALLRSVLGSYAGEAAVDLRLGTRGAGKPVLLAADGGPSAIRFNLSHSRSVWVLAVARDREVGIDVERLDRKVDVERLAARMFAPGEIAAIRRLDGNRQLAAFFRGWASREAIVKAMGAGMFSLPASFEVDVDPDRPLTVRPSSGTEFPWRLGPVPVPDDHVSALATEGAPVRIRSWHLD